MTSQEIKDKWLSIVRGMNERGVPLPMVRSDGKSSLTATFSFLSFNIWATSVIGKAAGALGGMDSGECLQMFVACMCFHLGRKMQRDNTGALSVGDTQPAKSSESKAPESKAPEAKSEEVLPG